MKCEVFDTILGRHGTKLEYCCGRSSIRHNTTVLQKLNEDVNLNKVLSMTTIHSAKQIACLGMS
jgi:hypothetical protein